MIYRNIKTGVEIESSCKLSGEHWQEVSPAGASAAAKKVPSPTKKEQVKKS